MALVFTELGFFEVVVNRGAVLFFFPPLYVGSRLATEP